jgi:predicted metal-binding membrane protein
MTSTTYPLPRERNLILVSLLVLAGIAWVLLIRQAQADDGMAMGLTMGMSAPLFLAIWVVMMAAMMFPTAAPMILVFARVSAGKRAGGQAFVPAWVFTGAYLLVWTAFGVVCYLAAIIAGNMAERSMWLMENAARIGGVVLILAGAYQLSPLKDICVSKCRTPMAFIMSSWRDGYGGAVRMGITHAAYCLGCCWLLFVLLLPLGMMNVAAMALITLLIFAEKSLPAGLLISRVAAAVLIAYGSVVLFIPDLLPTVL